MIQTKIQSYLAHSATANNRKLGKELFAKGAVTDLIYHSDLDEGTATVKSTKTYQVAIHNLLDQEEELETYCDCPQAWDNICKHQAAALYALQAKFEQERIAQGNLQLGTLVLTPAVFETYKKAFEITQVHVKPISITTTAVNFELEVKTQSWRKTIVPCNIEKKAEGWTFSNCCKQSYRAMCVHQSAIIYYIDKHWKGYTFFEKIENLSEEKDKALQSYHLPENIDFDDFFRLEFNVKAFEFKYVPFDNSFKSRSDAAAFIQNLKALRIKSEKIAIPFHNTLNPETGYGLSFYFDRRSRNRNVFFVRIILAKYNKERTKLVSSFEEYDGSVWVPDDIRFFTNELNHLLKMRAHSEAIEADFNSISHFLVQNIELLSRQHTFENEESHMISKATLKPMRFQKTPLKIHFDLVKKDHFYQLSARMNVHGNDISLSSAMHIESGHFLRYNEVIFVIPDYMTFATVAALISSPEIKVHENEKPELLQILNELSGYFEIDLNGLIEFENEALWQPEYQLYLSEIHSFLIIKPEVMYENGERYPLISDGFHWSYDENSTSLKNTTRNQEAENFFKKLLVDFDPVFENNPSVNYYFKSYDEIQRGHWFEKFFQFCKINNIAVFGMKDLKNMRYSPYSASINLGIKSTTDWFEAHIKVDFGTESIPLKKVREALERKEDFVKLSDGTLGMLPEKWIEKLAAVIRAGDIKGDSILIHKLKFNVVEQLFSEINDTTIQKEISEKKQQLEGFRNIAQVKIPKSIKGTLRNYQKEGFYWMNFLDEFGFGGCLADDMGLGKTIQLITFLAHQQQLKRGTSLVVVPKSLLFNWSAEIDKFCPGLKYMHYHGNRSFDAAEFAQYDVIITTYNTVANDIQKLRTFKFNYAVLDESQAIKNPLSKRYKAICLVKAKNRIVATGTPIENNTFDLYAQFNFLNPGLLGTQKYFKEQYAAPIDGKNDLQRADELRKLIHPFLLRRTKQQVANDLPEKTEQILTVEMGPAQREIYNEYLEKFKDYILGKIDKDGIQQSKMYILEGLMKLRQICNSPSLVKDSEYNCNESAKIDLLMEHLIPLVATNKVLVFSQFTSMLALIKDRLEAANITYSYLDGKTNHRMEIVNAFNESDANKVFLISLKAGGTGLNLTSADYVFLVDPWWNPAAEAQAIDRTHRIGQKNHVFAYKMICENTIEEKIVKLQQKKKTLSADLIQAQENFVKSLKKKDLEMLLN